MVTAAPPTADVLALLERLRSGDRSGHWHLALFGLRRFDAVHAASQIERGFSFAAFERFRRNTTLPLPELAATAAIPERTLARRRAAGRLASDESDRLARTSRVVARTIELFDGDVARARRWLLSPARALGGVTPLAFARTDVGALEVEQLIGRIEHGIPS